MVNIKTKWEVNERTVVRPQDWFDLMISPSDIDEACRKYMEDIDGAYLMDTKSGAVNTKFGIASFKQLSSGLKTVIVTHTLVKTGDTNRDIFVGCAGPNALEVIFKEVDNTNICLLLNHSSVPTIDKMEYNLNGVRFIEDSEEDFLQYKLDDALNGGE